MHLRILPGRRGITRVGAVLLFCMGFVLVGLAVILVQKMREKGNQALCLNHLREMGMAVYLYRDQAHPHALPPSRIADAYATWPVLLGPYLERGQGEELRTWDRSKTYFQQSAEARQAQVAAFYCPSRRSSPAESISGDVPNPNLPNAPNVPGALGDYACASGDGDPRFPWDSPRANGPIIPARVLKEGPDHAVLDWEGQTDLQVKPTGDGRAVVVQKGAGFKGLLRDELKRGTSETILLGEKHVPLGKFGRADAGDGSLYDGGRPANYARIGGPGHGLARSPEQGLDLAYPIFGSYHPGVCPFLMADGSARPISIDISPKVLGLQMVRGEE